MIAKICNKVKSLSKSKSKSKSFTKSKSKKKNTNYKRAVPIEVHICCVVYKLAKRPNLLVCSE